MKIHNDFILKEVAGNHLVIPTGEKMLDFSNVVKITESGVFLWEFLKKGTTEEELLQEMLKEYNVDEKTAKADIKAFVEVLRENKIIE